MRTSRWYPDRQPNPRDVQVTDTTYEGRRVGVVSRTVPVEVSHATRADSFGRVGCVSVPGDFRNGDDVRTSVGTDVGATYGRRRKDTVELDPMKTNVYFMRLSPLTLRSYVSSPWVSSNVYTPTSIYSFTY